MTMILVIETDKDKCSTSDNMGTNFDAGNMKGLNERVSYLLLLIHLRSQQGLARKRSCCSKSSDKKIYLLVYSGPGFLCQS